ncbi:hypothetical protein AB0D16_40480 [Streptomyces sp. NPDC048161]|uniref:hypothetical protein n=1 Tax=Streptomyces sp. NPDC048161 TaxID=3160985 RepID=UPI0033DC894F
MSGAFAKFKKQVQAAPEAQPAAAGPESIVVSVPDAEADGASAAPSVDTSDARKRRKRTLRKAAGAAEADAPESVPEATGWAARVPNRRLRWAIFNGSASGVGHLVIWSLAGDPMAGADYMARLSVSVPQLAAAGITLGAAVAGWKAARMIKLHRLPGPAGLAARPAAALGGALWGQGTAPVVRDAMAAIEPWGTLLAPLLAVAPIAAACWWGLDRNAAQSPLPVRWAARIPLATITVSSLLYAPGALL